jgi:hypothetical protein
MADQEAWTWFLCLHYYNSLLGFLVILCLAGTKGLKLSDMMVSCLPVELYFFLIFVGTAMLLQAFLRF